MITSNSSRSVLLGEESDAAGLGSVAGDHGSFCLTGGAGGGDTAFQGSLVAGTV